MKDFNQASVFSFTSADQRKTSTGTYTFEHMHSHTIGIQTHKLLNAEVHQPSSRWSSVTLSSCMNCFLSTASDLGGEREDYSPSFPTPAVAIGTILTNQTKSPWKPWFISR